MRLKPWQKWTLATGCGCTSLLVALALFLYIPFALNWFASPQQRPADLPPVVTLPVEVATAAENEPIPEGNTPLPPLPTVTQETKLPLIPFAEAKNVELSPYPYITGVGARVREIFEAGQQLGNRPNVFSKVGDSISYTAAYLAPFGKGNYNLGVYAYLQPVIDFFRAETARTSDSFQNESLAAFNGWRAATVLAPSKANQQVCELGENPLVCEYRVTRPAVALIMLGTNDVIPTPPKQFEQQMRRILDISIEMGVIPVLSTIPEYKQVNMHQEVAEFNAIIATLAQEYQIPLWDYHLIISGLPNNGIGEDGVHPSVSYSHPAEFTTDYLGLGMTVRNLSALQVLDALYWAIINPQ
ncbi:MAG: SGNH/GDSL hydrolase family protein [Anaerolineales bacterium]|nr:SGNH/GDSL hydrolase family protein [Anaerolineales bacterium]